MRPHGFPLKAAWTPALMAVLFTLVFGLGRALEKPRDQGIGGTGAFGEITGFGSVFVNGIEFDTDMGALIRSDLIADPDAPPKLAIGQVVHISSPGQGTHIPAETVAIEHEVIGQIESVDAATEQMWILGQPISFAAVWDRSGIEEGKWVGVSGFRDAFGVVQAHLVESAREGLFQVIGEPELQPEIFGAAIAEKKLAGRVVVRGVFANNRPKIQEISRWNYLDERRTPGVVSLEGYFSIRPGNHVDLTSGQLLTTPSPASTATADAPPTLAIVNATLTPASAPVSTSLITQKPGVPSTAAVAATETVVASAASVAPVAMVVTSVVTPNVPIAATVTAPKTTTKAQTKAVAAPKPVPSTISKPATPTPVTGSTTKK